MVRTIHQLRAVIIFILLIIIIIIIITVVFLVAVLGYSRYTPSCFHLAMGSTTSTITTTTAAATTSMGLGLGRSQHLVDGGLEGGLPLPRPQSVRLHVWVRQVVQGGRDVRLHEHGLFDLQAVVLGFLCVAS